MSKFLDSDDLFTHNGKLDASASLCRRALLASPDTAMCSDDHWVPLAIHRLAQVDLQTLSAAHVARINLVRMTRYGPGSEI